MSPTGATASTVAPWSLAPWSLTPWMLAPWRLTPPRLTAPPRSAPRRLTSRRSAFPRSTPRRLTSPRLEPRRLTSPRSAFRRLTFRRSTFARSAPRRLMSSRLEPRRSAPPRMAPRRLMSPRLRPRRSASRRLAPWFTAISRASRHDGASIENNSAVFNNRLRISILMAAPPSSSRPHQVVPDHAGHAEAESAVVTARSIGPERFERCGDASEFLRYFSEKIDETRTHRLNLLRPHGKHVRNGDAPIPDRRTSATCPRGCGASAEPSQRG